MFTEHFYYYLLFLDAVKPLKHNGDIYTDTFLVIDRLQRST